MYLPREFRKTLRSEEDGFTDPANPDHYASDDKSLTDYTFCHYASQIDEFPDEHFDLILIDGRARASCIKHSVSKVQVGGMIIIDNSDRSYYFTQSEAYLAGFSKKEFFGVGPISKLMWKTDIYVREK